MDSLPSARKCMSSSHSCPAYPIYPASIKTDEDRPHPGDRFGRRDDFSSSRRKLLILRFVLATDSHCVQLIDHLHPLAKISLCPPNPLTPPTSQISPSTSPKVNLKVSLVLMRCVVVGRDIHAVI